MTIFLALSALIIAILAFAHSIRMARWLKRIEARDENPPRFI